MYLKRFFYMYFVLFMSALVACGGGPAISASYKPPVPLPVKLVITTSGEVSIETDDASLATPWGEFAIGAQLPVASMDSSRDVLIILQDRDCGTEKVYKVVAGEEARLITNGTTEIRVGTDRKVVIDITTVGCKRLKSMAE